MISKLFVKLKQMEITCDQGQLIASRFWMALTARFSCFFLKKFLLRFRPFSAHVMCNFSERNLSFSSLEFTPNVLVVLGKRNYVLRVLQSPWILDDLQHNQPVSNEMRKTRVWSDQFSFDLFLHRKRSLFVIFEKNGRNFNPPISDWEMIRHWQLEVAMSLIWSYSLLFVHGIRLILSLSDSFLILLPVLFVSFLLFRIRKM